jgi:hypothetical protein
MVAQMRVGDSKKRSVQMLLAVIVALPFLAIFLVLFSSADLVFKSSISGLADAFGGKFWAQAFLVVVVALFSAGALTVAALQKGAKAAPATSEGQEKQNLTFVVTFLSLINALFLFFIVIQVRYFFAGPEGLQGFGFTYADYVHKGFFELVAVALLSFLLLYGAEAMVVRPDGKHAAAFKWSSGLHIALVVVIILSAFRRLSLYEQAYGFTELRLYVHAFVIWLAVVFGLLMLKVVMNTEARRFSFQILVSALLGFALLNLLNPDAFVARKNLARLEATDKIDIEYLTSLSSDSLPVIVSGLGAKDQAMLTDYLTQYRNNHPLAKTPAPWQSFNFATSKAEAVMSVK